MSTNLSHIRDIKLTMQAWGFAPKPPRYFYNGNDTTSSCVSSA